MRKFVSTCLTSGLLFTSGYAQTLFTYGNNPVTKQEFLRGYQKNSINKKPDMSDTALREYLNLYSLFRMKVREAELMKLDTSAMIKAELDNYRRQLAKNYLTDEQVNSKLVQEAYERMKEEINVAHILIMAPASVSPADSLNAYRRIDSIYQAVTKNKADFAGLAKQFSDDRGSKANGGEIGYITALQTVYPFENAIYETKPGTVSKPFRTQFGYHIVKVSDRRPASGEIQVSQILITAPASKGEAGVAEAKRKIEEIKKELKKGTSFAELAKKYSDDKFSVEQGGLMEPFGVGRMTPVFERAAFALKKPGDISEPVQTEFGYHIIKLEKKMPVKSYDSLYATLKKRVDNDSRSQTARDIFFEKVKQKNNYKEYPASYNAVLAHLMKIPDTGREANTFGADYFSGMKQPMLSIGGITYTQADFGAFAHMITRGRLLGPRETIMRDLFNMYSRNMVSDFQENQLIKENEDFRNLMEEYRSGIMLFDLMEKNVWGKASRDTVGLKAFYEKNKGKYLWEPGFKGAVYRFKDEQAKNEGLKLLAANAKNEDIIKQLNTETRPDAVTIQVGQYEFRNFKDVPQEFIVKGKVSEAMINPEKGFTVVKADEVFTTPTVKSLEDARGYAVAEYQDYLEKQWNEQLRAKYPVQVKEDVFRSMVQ